jgi:hypothetical protein
MRNEQRRAKPGEEIKGCGRPALGSSTLDHRHEHRDIVLGFQRERSARRQVAFIPIRACIVGGQEAR